MTQKISRFSFADDTILQQFSDEVRSAINESSVVIKNTALPTAEYIIDDKMYQVFTILYELSGDTTTFPLNFNSNDFEIFEINGIAKGNGRVVVIPSGNNNITLAGNQGTLTFQETNPSAYNVYITVKYGG